MIHVQGEDPTAILSRTAHHARALIPLVDALTAQMFYSRLHTDEDRHHHLWQSRGGANSFGLYLDEFKFRGAVYHFRGYDEKGLGYDVIRVYDNYYYGDTEPLFVLRTRGDCRNFVEAVVTEAYAVSA